MTGDSVVKTLLILFFIAIVPLLLAGVVALGWLFLAVTGG